METKQEFKEGEKVYWGEYEGYEIIKYLPKTNRYKIKSIGKNNIFNFNQRELIVKGIELHRNLIEYHESKIEHLNKRKEAITKKFENDINYLNEQIKKSRYCLTELK